MKEHGSHGALDALTRSIGIVGRVASRVHKPPGAAPGTLVHAGEQKTDQMILRYFDYDAESLREGLLASGVDCDPFVSGPSVTWIDVAGLHAVSEIESIGQAFGLHPLMLEDVLSPRQRPKTDEYEGYLYVVLKACLRSPDPVRRH